MDTKEVPLACAPTLNITLIAMLEVEVFGAHGEDASMRQHSVPLVLCGARLGLCGVHSHFLCRCGAYESGLDFGSILYVPWLGF